MTSETEPRYGLMAHSSMLAISGIFRLIGEEDADVCIELLMRCAEDETMLACWLQRSRSPVPAVPRATRWLQ